MSDPTPLPEPEEMLAAELAFALLEGDDERDATARLDRDPAFARAHAIWQDRAAAMVSAAPETPRPSLWQDIAHRLPANDDTPVTATGAVRRWQGATALATAAAVVLAIVALDRPALPPPPPPPPAVVAPAAPLVAILIGDAGKGVVAISYDRASGRMVTVPHALDLGTRAAELWVIPAGGKPVSLGIIAAADAGHAEPGGIARPALSPGATLAISVEPAGGSPTGQPTGPVILTGTMASG